HELTKELPLDFFVTFSSTSAFGGSLEQAAANAFLDALAETRRAQGLAALNIGWGPWSRETDTLDASQRRLESRGVGSLAPETSLNLLARALARGRPHLG